MHMDVRILIKIALTTVEIMVGVVLIALHINEIRGNLPFQVFLVLLFIIVLLINVIIMGILKEKDKSSKKASNIGKVVKYVFMSIIVVPFVYGSIVMVRGVDFDIQMYTTMCKFFLLFMVCICAIFGTEEHFEDFIQMFGILHIRRADDDASIS